MKRQLTTCILIIIIASILGGMIIQRVSYAETQNTAIETTEKKLSSLADILSIVSDEEMDIYDQYDRLSISGVNLVALTLKDHFVDGEYTGRRLFEGGAVVRLVDGKLEFPEHEGVFIPDITPDMLTDDESFNITTPDSDGNVENVYIVISIHLNGDYYYVDWSRANEYLNLFNSRDTSGLLVYVENSYDCNLAVYNDKGAFLYCSDLFRRYDNELDKDFFAGKNKVKIENTEYLTNHIMTSDSQWEIFVLTPTYVIDFENFNWTFIYIMLLILICVTLITWTFSLKNMVIRHQLTDAQIRRYDPQRVKIYNYVALIIVSVSVFLFSLLISGMITLRRDMSRGDSMLSSVQSGLINDIEVIEETASEKRDWYLYYGETIAQSIDDSGQIPDSQRLAEYSEAIGSQYIIIYDENGKQVVSSNDFSGLELGTADKDQSTDFRRLLRGVKSIVHQPAHDDFSGLDSQQIGIRINMPESGEYGAMVISLAPEVLNLDFDSFVAHRIMAMTDVNDILFVADSDNGLITNCSNPHYTELNMSDFNINIADRFDNKIGINNLFDIKYYVQTNPDLATDNIYYYFSADTFSPAKAFNFGLIFTVLLLIPFVLCLYFSMRGYDKEFYDANVLNGDSPIADNFIKIMLSDGRNKRTVDISERFSFLPDFWTNMLPENRARSVFTILLGLIILFTFIWITNGYDVATYGMFSFLTNGNWQNGVNLFAIFSIFMLLVITSLVMNIIRYLLLVISIPLDTKGETICRLIYSMLQYIMLIVILYFSFGYLGFDTTSILASVGFLTLAISIGSRDLVADVLAGITIVFEGEYQVGDMVEIGGYRGQVQEIGVRSTKIIGRGNNVKIIGNRDVKNVINLTRMNSWIPIEVKIPISEPLDKIEAVLEEELPKIGKKNPKILGGPYYYGILSFDKGSAVISIMTECHEQDYNNLQRYLNKELYELFRQKKIPLG